MGGDPNGQGGFIALGWVHMSPLLPMDSSILRFLSVFSFTRKTSLHFDPSLIHVMNHIVVGWDFTEHMGFVATVSHCNEVFLRLFWR